MIREDGFWAVRGKRSAVPAAVLEDEPLDDKEDMDEEDVDMTDEELEDMLEYAEVNLHK